MRLGGEIMGRAPTPVRSEVVFGIRFLAFFGLDPAIVCIVWKRLLDAYDDGELKDSKPEHLLWALMGAFSWSC